MPLVKIMVFERILLTKSEMKTMYKKSESDISVCYTINRADMKGKVVVGTLVGTIVVDY